MIYTTIRVGVSRFQSYQPVRFIEDALVIVHNAISTIDDEAGVNIPDRDEFFGILTGLTNRVIEIDDVTYEHQESQLTGRSYWLIRIVKTGDVWQINEWFEL